MKRKLLIYFILFLFSNTTFAVVLQSLKVQENAGKTSVFFTLSDTSAYKTFILTNPRRIVIDFPNTSSNINVNQIANGNSLISKIRAGRPSNGIFRLVFDVKDGARYKVINWKPTNLKKNGLKLEIFTNYPNPIKSQSVNSHSKPKIQAHVKHSVSKPLRDIIVVIDPGHGGKDPGAIGPRYIAEKSVVLAIALKLKQSIDRERGMRAVLTRNGDNYIGLRERLNIARHYNADLFISIHADAFINKHSSGASVFALSPRGATSEAARWLAEKENYSELGGVNLKGLDDANGVIRTVLLDLSQTATINSSLQVGSRLLKQMNKITSLHNSSVEQARFVVLKSPDIPSVLIETGFITNIQEEKNLSNPSYQSRLAQSIFSGVKYYFAEYPPHGTRLESMANTTLHIVKAGETLPAIAARYNVSVGNLKQFNNLTNTKLKPMQKLNIPAAWA